MMTMMEQWLPVILQQEVVDARTAESFAYLDVGGYNYTESRYAMDHELHPHRVIVGSETNPATIARNWELVRELPHLIGDFTWTGWDYLGEAGIGRMRYATDDVGEARAGSWGSTHGSPQLRRHRHHRLRLPVSYWREIVWGLRGHAVRRGASARPPRREQPAGRWTFTDAIASWSWPGSEDQPVTVEVYADADEVELLLDGESADGAAAETRTRTVARSTRPTRPASSPRSRTATAPRPVDVAGVGDAERCSSTCGSTAR